MTLTDDEIRRLAAMLSEPRERAGADEILELIASKGERFPSDKAARCRAFASFLRSLLADENIQKILKLAHERVQFRTAIADMYERVQRGVPPVSGAMRNLVHNMEETEHGIAAEIERLKNQERAKLWLLENLVDILRDLGCDERFDLPTVQMRLPELG